MTTGKSSVDSHLTHESASFFRDFDGDRQRHPNPSQSALQITEQDAFVNIKKPSPERNPSTVASSQKAPVDDSAVHAGTRISSERLMHMRIPSRSAPFSCDNDIDDDDSNECLISSLVACDKNVERCFVITTSPGSNSDQSRFAATAGSVMSPGGGVDNSILGPSAILPSHAVYTGTSPAQPQEQKSDDADITHKSITTQKYGSEMLPGAFSRSSLPLTGSPSSSGFRSVRSILGSDGGGDCRIIVPNMVSSPQQRTRPNKRRGTTQNKKSRKRKSRARKEPWENDEETSDEACFDSEEELSSLQNIDCADDAALALQLHYDEKKRAAASECTSDAVCGSREDPLICSDDVAETNNPRDVTNFRPPPRRCSAMRTRSNTNTKQTFLNICVNGELTTNFTADEDDEDLLLAKALSQQDADNDDVHVAEHILAGCGAYEANFRARIDDQVRRGVMNSLQAGQLIGELHATEIVGGVDCNETRSCTAFDRLESAETEETLDADRGLILGYIAHLCRPPTDHFAWNLGDDKWGCGFRNAQMLWSAINRHPVLREHLAGQLRAADLDDASAVIAISSDVSAKASSFVPDAAASSGPFPVPSIHMLQKLISRAWRLGYDAHGAEELHHEIVGTDKWIGPTEVHALLTSLAVECRGAVFHLHAKAAVDAKGVPKNAHMCSYSNTGSLRTYRTLFDAMFDWVERHFTQLNKEYKFPIYLQHAGHSRTIVGFEKMPKGDGFERKLLLFDPATKLAMKTSTGRSLLRLVRRLPSNFKVGQWQMLTVTGRVLSCGEQLALRQPDAASFESFEFLDERNVS